MPTDSEQRLLALIAPAIRVEAQVVSGEPNANGDVYPEGLLTAGDDVLNAVMMDSARASLTMEVPANSPEATAILEGSAAGVSMGASIEPDPLLSDLFMNREAQDAMEALGATGGDAHVASGDHIAFDMEANLPGTGAPNEAVRFQVGRQSPPPTTFNRELHPGPSEGQVVSRRSPTGQFEAIRRRAMDSPALRPADPVRRADPLARPPVVRNIRRPAGPPQPPPPTRWERLNGPDPFDD